MALTRSQQMARIKGRDTRPERRLRSALWARGLRYRLGAKVPIGRPDIVFPTQQVAVFVDGCFWHGCPLHYVRPRTRHDFWAGKLQSNVTRDRRHTLTLEAAGWRVLRFWEHDVTDSLDVTVAAIARVVNGHPIPSAPAWRVDRVDLIDPAHDTERRFHIDLRDETLRHDTEGPRRSRSGKPMRRRKPS